MAQQRRKPALKACQGPGHTQIGSRETDNTKKCSFSRASEAIMPSTPTHAAPYSRWKTAPKRNAFATYWLRMRWTGSTEPRLLPIIRKSNASWTTFGPNSWRHNDNQPPNCMQQTNYCNLYCLFPTCACADFLLLLYWRDWVHAVELA